AGRARGMIWHLGLQPRCQTGAGGLPWTQPLEGGGVTAESGSAFAPGPRGALPKVLAPLRGSWAEGPGRGMSGGRGGGVIVASQQGGWLGRIRAPRNEMM